MKIKVGDPGVTFPATIILMATVWALVPVPKQHIDIQALDARQYVTCDSLFIVKMQQFRQRIDSDFEKLRTCTGTSQCDSITDSVIAKHTMRKLFLDSIVQAHGVCTNE